RPESAVRRAPRARPGRRPPHHPAPEAGLSSDRCHEKGVLPAGGAAGFWEPALEALDRTAGVDELLLARVERMAVRADLDVELGLRRPRLERVSAGTRDGCDDVVGMDVRLHGSSARIAAAVFGATLPPETTAATFWPGSRSSRPLRSAAAVAAPASSHASFIRPYMKRNPATSSSSVTRKDSTASALQTATQFSPAYGPLRPSAADSASTVTA